MAGIGVVMSCCLRTSWPLPIASYIAVSASDWNEGARRAGQVALFVRINFAPGWLAIAAVLLWH